MPIIIWKENSSYDYLLNKDVPMIDPQRAKSQDIRPLEIAICNLMPQKVITEQQIFRLLWNTPLQIKPTLFNFDHKQILTYYQKWSDVQNHKFDWLIVTWANAEKLLFEATNHREQVEEMFERSKSNAFRSLYLCWWAMAWLYHHYWVEKHVTDKKIFWVKKFGHDWNHFLLTGCDDDVYMPISCWAKSPISHHQGLRTILWTNENPAIIVDNDNKHTFIIPHPEYDRWDLSKEYVRDVLSSTTINLPQNYFVNEEWIHEFIELDSQDQLRIILSLPDWIRNEIFSEKYLKDRKAIALLRELSNKFEQLTPVEISKRSGILRPKLLWRANAQVIFNNWIKDLYDKTPADIHTIWNY